MWCERHQEYGRGGNKKDYQSKVVQKKGEKKDGFGNMSRGFERERTYRTLPEEGRPGRKRI